MPPSAHPPIRSTTIRSTTIRSTTIRSTTIRRIMLAIVLTSACAACVPPVARTGSDSPSGASGPPAGSATPAAPSGPTGPRTFVPPTPTPLPTFVVHVVSAGENLNTIAHQFGTTARSIAFWNRATYPSLDPLSPGYKPGIVKIGWTLLVIPNVVFDEQDLPDPTPSDDPAALDPSDAPPS
jgi:hypothetical protein